MNNYDNIERRDPKVILAWIVLALQILGLLWLLLFARDRLAALAGQDTDRQPETVTMAQPSPSPQATDEPATAEPEPAATTERAEPPPTTTTEAAAIDESAPEIDNGEVVGPESVLIESSAVAPDWLATLVEGKAADSSTGRPGMPPHLLLTFVGPESTVAEPAAPDTIDLTRPQVRIIPIAALLSMLEQNNDEEGQQALNDLLMLLEQQPEAGEASIPVPPVLGDVVQNFVSRPTYRAFGGGSGVGYFTNITGEEVTPVTNESGLNYIYQGITADGKQYVFMSWPMDAAFLPEGQEEADEQADMLAADRESYFVTLQQQVQAATEPDLNPSPTTLADLIRSLSIGGEVATEEPEVASQTVLDALGYTWYWTGSTNATGEESTVEQPQDYSLVLWPDGAYSVRADCNVGGGTYIYDTDESIRLQPGPLTRARCPEGSRDNEFIQSLLTARAIDFNESGDMVLQLEDGGSMILANVGEAEMAGGAAADDQPEAIDVGLAGYTFQWPGFADANGDVVEVDNPEDYLLTLLPDGTFNVVADCNIGGGTYTFGEDGTLQLGPIRLTRMACPEGSRGDDFLSFLQNVSRAEVNEDGSAILNTSDGRSATFVNLGEVGISQEATDTETAQVMPTGDSFNTIWQWTGFTPADGEPTVVGNPEAYYLILIDDGTYAFRADCNNGAGSYTLDGEDLTLAPAAVTLAACGEESLSDTFVDYLGRARSLAFDDDANLVLTLDDGSLLTFENGGPFTGTDTGTGTGGATATGPSAADPLAGTSWQWTYFRDMKQDFNVTGTYTLAFAGDGSVSVTADCNSGSGTYAVDGEAGLSISIRAVTAAACAQGSLGDTFIENLNFAGLFSIDNGTLAIELMADGGTMTFTASQ